MSKAELAKANYEELVKKYVQAQKQTQDLLMNYANVIAEAIEQLGKKQWIKWLSDSRVNLQKSQAYKFVALSAHCKNSVQLTGLLKDKQIEKAYLLTKIKEPEKQNEIAGKIIDADFTVKQTKKAVELINNDFSTEQAIEEARKITPKVIENKIRPPTIPKEEFDKLKHEYDSLLAKYKQLLEQQSKPKANEPEPTEQPDGTIDKENRRYAYKGYWLPVSEAMNIDAKDTEYMKYDAISNAKRLYNLDIE